MKVSVLFPTRSHTQAPNTSAFREHRCAAIGKGLAAGEQTRLALFLEPVALALDVDDRRVMEQPVEGALSFVRVNERDLRPSIPHPRTRNKRVFREPPMGCAYPADSHLEQSVVVLTCLMRVGTKRR